MNTPFFSSRVAAFFRLGLFGASIVTGCFAQVLVWIPPKVDQIWHEPWTETITTPAVYGTRIVPAVTHKEWVPEVFHWESRQVTKTVRIPASTTVVHHPEEQRVIHHPASTQVVHHPEETITIHFSEQKHIEHHPEETHVVTIPGYYSSEWVDYYATYCWEYCEWVYDEYSEGGSYNCWTSDDCWEEWIGGDWVDVWNEGSEYTETTPAWDEEVIDVPEHDEFITIPEWDETITIPEWDETITIPEWDETITIPEHDETITTTEQVKVVDVPAHEIDVVDEPEHEERYLISEESTREEEHPGWYEPVVIPGRWITVRPLTVVHPETGPMPQTRQDTFGGLVPVRRDSTTPITKLQLQSLPPEANSPEYRLYWYSEKIRIWQDENRTQPVESNSTVFPTNVTTTVFIEGITPSTQMRDVGIALTCNAGTVQANVTVVRSELETWVRAFIPYDWVKVTHPAYGFIVAKGDHRDYDPSLAGTYRMQQVAVITPFPDLHPSHIKRVYVGSEPVEIIGADCGESRHYFWGVSLTNPGPFLPLTLPPHSGLQVNGSPGYLKPEALADDDTGPAGGNYLAAKGTAGIDGFSVQKQLRTATLTTVRFKASAGEPLVIPAANIDWDLVVAIDVTNPITPRHLVTGTQDGFPGYEVYIKTSKGMPQPNEVTSVYQWVPPLYRAVDSLLPVYDDETVYTGWNDL